MEFLFAAFISEQKVRIGRTGSIAARIGALKSRLNSIGGDIHSLLLTSPMDDAEKFEKDVLQILSARMEKASPNTFFYTSKEDVEDVFLDLRLQFMHALDVKALKVGKNYKICALLNHQDFADVEFAKVRYGSPAIERIVKAIKKNGGSITHGLLRNKFRKVNEDDLLEVIQEMHAAGIIKVRSVIHKYNKDRIKKYTLVD